MVLAARPRRSRGARVPRSRERLHAMPRSRTSQPLREALFDEIVARVQETDASAPIRRAGYEYFTRTVEGSQYAVHCRRPAGTRRAARPDGGTGVPRRRGRHARRERARRRARLLRGRRPHRESRPARSPRTPPTPPGASATSSASAPCPPRTARGTGPDRRRARRLLRRGVGERRPHRLLHPARRRHAPVAGLAPHPRHARRRRRARVPGGRRPVLRRRRPHAERALHRDHLSVEDDDRGVARRRRRRRPPRRRSSSRAHRATSTTSSTTPDPAGDRLFVLTNADGAENFKLLVTPASSPGRGSLGRPWCPTVPTSASTTSTRSPAHLVVSERADGARAAPRARRSATTVTSPTTT